MSIAVVIPVWNGRPLLEKLLTSIAAQTEPPSEVLAVDNGSTDGAPDYARNSGARVIAMGRNAGFAAAVNRGIRESRAEWIAVLNTDVTLAPDYFAALRASAEADGAWFAAGTILDARNPKLLDGTFDLTCRGGTAWRAGNGQFVDAAYSAKCRISSAPWTAALFRAELFERVGLLEESFESYLEDADFGLRCAQAGLAGIYEPAAIAWHQGSAALGRWHAETVRRTARNQLLLLARHYSRESLLLHWPRILAAQLLWGCLAFRHGRGMAWLVGKWQGLQAWDGASQSPVRWDPQQLRSYLEENERLIRRFQSAGGYDWYWKVYFSLTYREAK